MTGPILVVSPLATQRIALAVMLRAACHKVQQAASAAEALGLCRDHTPALVLSEAELPDLPLVEFLQRLRALPVGARLPVLVFGQEIAAHRRAAYLAAGADDVLPHPFSEAALLARLRRQISTRASERELERRAIACRAFGLSEAPVEFVAPARVALVAKDLAVALGWRTRLAPHLAANFQLMQPPSALSAATEPIAPELYLLAAEPEESEAALQLVTDLRARTGYGADAAKICLATANPGGPMAALALDLGADALVSLPFEAKEAALILSRQIERRRYSLSLQRAVSKGLQLAATDALTGLWNRRFADAELERLARKVLTNGSQLAILLLDLDRFKTINDRFGHQIGDFVLQAVADRLRRAMASVAPDGLLARFGGEEFLAAVAPVTRAEAQGLAEALRETVANEPIAIPGYCTSVSTTVSVGFALVPDRSPANALSRDAARAWAWPTGLEDNALWAEARALVAEALQKADSALYSAKAKGRNHVICSHDSLSEPEPAETRLGPISPRPQDRAGLPSL